MMLDNPVTRLVLKAMSVCGLVRTRRDSEVRRERVEQKDSPFVLVGRSPDGRWAVFQRDFNRPLAAFDELQVACNYANELAKTREGSMVLVQNNRDSTPRSARSGLGSAA